MDVIFGICGFIGAMLCAIGDLLLDLKGKDNRKRGKLGIMDSAWDHMDVKRFTRSILLAMFGTPMAFLGFTAMARQLSLANGPFGLVFWLVSVIGCSGSFFIHTIICLFPVIYKKVEPEHGFDYAEEIINTIYTAIRVPFWVLYIALTGVTSMMLIWALFAGYLPLSPWCSLLTVPSLIVIGALLQKLNPNWFCDLPIIITPSLGLGMFGLLAAISAW